MAKAALQLVDKESGVDKQKALETALGNIERSFGKGSVMRLGDKKVMDVEAVPTGSLGLDIALGIGGLPKGRIIEIYGPESSGKTTLALHSVAEAQKNGGVCAFIDAEHALDPLYAGKLGVDLDDLLISQPDTGEQALDIRRIGAIKDRDEVVGNQTRVKVVKNKVAPPFRQVEFDILYGEGISKTGELIDLGVKAEVVEKAGSWYSYKGERMGQGREKTRNFLKENPAIADEIEDAIRRNAGLLADELLNAGMESEQDDDLPDAAEG